MTEGAIPVYALASVGKRPLHTKKKCYKGEGFQWLLLNYEDEFHRETYPMI
jgi:hypothetical protein